MISACQDDLSYLVPSNSSTVQITFDPNAPTKTQVDDACAQAVNLYLFGNLFELLVFKLILFVSLLLYYFTWFFDTEF